jgi:SpoVK/Ycf46/Vps4 family AAA+-type ATPase
MGMVFLFHGDPGIVKTLMAGSTGFTQIEDGTTANYEIAESVSDYCRRPLIRLDASTLGARPDTVENGLSQAFKLAETWNAVVLLDEADVFLEERRISELARNSLVSGKPSPSSF